MNTRSNTSLHAQEVLLQNLQQASLYPHQVEEFTLLQTHISWVLLTGNFAYKIKKTIDLGFLDFSTLELRKHFCEEELRLNRRYAPELYLDIVNITGSHEHPRLNGQGPVIEYAIKMKQFPQSAQLDVLLADGKLTTQHIDGLAEVVAAFHQNTEQARSDTNYGQAAQVYHPILENFKHIRHTPGLEQYASRLDALEHWCQKQFKQLQSILLQRKQAGFIREGHGDMHLRNLALLNEQVILFDCLEFDPALRWIDVINDIAFLIMDLDVRQQSSLAWRFLNRYLEITGDYAGAQLLNFYNVYRALVRAKVDAIRLGQPHLTHEEQKNTRESFFNYIKLAEEYMRPRSPVLVITRGLSGTGKTSYTQQLLEAMGAIRIRSDVERKRLFKENTDLYSKQTTQQVYQHLAQLTEELLAAGYPVLVDATFLESHYIEKFLTVAKQHNVPFHILEFSAKPDTLRNRIRLRKQDYSDATVDVLQMQLQQWQAVPESLQGYLLQLDTENEIDIKQLATKLKAS